MLTSLFNKPASNALHTSTFPFHAARCSGMQPWLSFPLAWAPAFTRRSTAALQSWINSESYMHRRSNGAKYLREGQLANNFKTLKKYFSTPPSHQLHYWSTATSAVNWKQCKYRQNICALVLVLSIPLTHIILRNIKDRDNAPHTNHSEYQKMTVYFVTERSVLTSQSKVIVE